MKKELSTSINIQATPEKVWAILTDFKHYPEWNPFIKKIEGDLQLSKKIRARIEPPQANGMTFTPKITRLEPKKGFSWLGHLIIPGLFDGEHSFELIENNDGSTTFVQSEKFAGILIPFFKKMLEDNTKRGFESMNLKIKERAEQR